jgi:hypothetical protein
MSILTSVADFRVTTRILAVGTVLLAVSLPVESATLPQQPCTSHHAKLLADWDAAGFETPSKPSQSIVHGRNGRISSGPEVTYMISRIRLAARDCQHGDDQSVR